MTQLYVICAYLGVVLLVGLFANRLFRGTKDDYLLASHSIGPFLLLMSLFGTTMTAFALIGSTGEAFKAGIGVYGMLASASGIVHSLCFFVIGVKIYQFGRAGGYATQIQFFRARLNNDFIGLLLFPILVGLIVPYLLIGVMGAGVTIESMTAGAFPNTFPTESPATHGGVPSWLSKLVICAVVLTYVFFGGMRGTTWANALQTMVFMALGIVTFVVIAYKLGGQETFLGNLAEIAQRIPENRSSRSEMSRTLFFSYMLIPLSVGMFPHVFQHWLTARNANAFKLPIVVHPIFILLVWAPCVLIGVWATTDLVPALPTLPNGAVNANAILPFLVQTMTTPLLGGLLAAGILAAIMSSLDSQFLCVGSMFTNDIVGHYGKFTDRQMVWMARGFIVGIVVVTYVISLLDYRNVFTMAIWCFSGYAGLFPLVFLALYWRRLTAPGAISGVLAMAVSWGYLFYLSGFGKVSGYAIELDLGISLSPEIHWLGGKYQVMPVVAVLLCTLIVTVVVSLFTKPPAEKVLTRFFPENR